MLTCAPEKEQGMFFSVRVTLSSTQWPDAFAIFQPRNCRLYG